MPRRSCLTVPASRPRFHEKADGSAADMVVLDLEDSIAPSAKEAAREAVVGALRRYDYRAKVRAVRVNAVDSPWCLDDVRHVVYGAGDRLDCIVVPKVEDVDHVHFMHHLLDQLEAERRIGLDLQIETARGLENSARIAAASPRCRALVFGPGDFAADLRMPGLTIGGLRPEYPGELWHFFQARILVAARASGLMAIDGPFAQVRDLDGLAESARRAALLGYDGKWALNPAQVDVLNAVFAPSQEDFDRASAIVEAYQRATDEDATGAIVLGDEMIDEATRKLAMVTVERGRALDMRRSSPRDGGG